MKVLYFIIAAVLAAGAAVAVIFIKKAKNKSRYLSVIDAPPPKVRLYKIPQKSECSTPLERIFSERFSAFVEASNGYIKECARLEYLNERRDAELKLARQASADVSKEKISECKRSIAQHSANMEKLRWYNYSFAPESSAFEIFTGFKELAELMPEQKLPPEPMRSFAPQKKLWMELKSGIWLMPCEFYAVVWFVESGRVKILDYASVVCKSDYTIVTLPEGTPAKKGDEVASKRWRHESSEGVADKRYKDNPVTVQIYRGHLIFSVLGAQKRVDYPTKRAALKVEKKMNSYKSLLAGKIGRKYVEAVFSSSEHYFRVENIEKLISINEQREKRERENAAQERRAQREARTAKGQSKKKTEVEEKKATSAAPETVKSDFSDDEISMIFELRREKEREAEAKTKAHTRRLSAIENAMGEMSEKCPVSHLGATRVITNNLFSFNYRQEYIVFFDEYSLILVDERGENISKAKRVPVPAVGAEFRVDFELLSGVDFDAEKSYFLLVMSSDEEEIFGVIDYKINISFVSDFDF